MLKGIKVAGPIRPSDAAEWECMVWQDAPRLLPAMKYALTASPPSYISVVGPPQSGKTTLINQLQHEFESGTVPFIFTYFDSLCLNVNDRLGNCIASLLASLQQQLLAQLNELGHTLSPHPTPDNLEDSDFNIASFLVPLLDNIPKPFHLALVLDNIDTGHVAFRSLMLNSLRWVYGRRLSIGLSRFTAITTSCERLDIDHVGIRSPYNTAEVVISQDFTLAEMERMVTCIATNNTVTFSSEATAFLFAVTSGVASITSDVLSFVGTAQPVVSIDDMMLATAKYLGTSSRLSRLVLAQQNISVDGLNTLGELLCNRPVLANDMTPGVADLKRLGIISANAANRCVFRCQLIKWSAATLFPPVVLPPQKSLLSSVLIQLPVIRCMLFDSRFSDTVVSLVNSQLRRESGLARATMSFEAAVTAIQNLNLTVDWRFVQQMVGLYWSPEDGPLPQVDDISTAFARLAAEHINA